MKKDSIINILKYDIKLGSITRIITFVLYELIFIIMSLYTYNVFNKSINSTEKFVVKKIGYVDILIGNMWGIKEYIPEKKDPFIIPFMVFAFIIILLIRVVLYPVSDMKKNSSNIIYRLDKKNRWWHGKVIWCLFETTGYVILYCFTTFVISLIVNKGHFIFGGNVSTFLLELDYCEINISHIIEYLFVLFIIMYTTSLLSILIALVSNMFFAFFTIITLFISACFYYSDILLYSNIMVVRNNIFINDGLNNINVIIYCLIIYILTVFIGDYIFRNKDIY